MDNNASNLCGCVSSNADSRMYRCQECTGQNVPFPTHSVGKGAQLVDGLDVSFRGYRAGVTTALSVQRNQL